MSCQTGEERCELRETGGERLELSELLESERDVS